MYQATRRVQLFRRRVSLSRSCGVEPPQQTAAQALPFCSVLPGLQQRCPQLQAGKLRRYRWE